MSFAQRSLKFFLNLKEPEYLGEGISVINPYENKIVQEVVSSFYTKYFNDNKSRVFVLGINPGRFGGGITGISFTDPVALRDFCKIENSFGEKRELSSIFVYEVISKFGGCKNFYSSFFLSAVYPLAIIKDGKNHNYYDSKKLFNTLKNDIKNSLLEQYKLGAKKNVVISLGKKNAEFIQRINNKLNLFQKVEYLEHPRFIMQYRRRKKDEYIDKYLEMFSKYV